MNRDFGFTPFRPVILLHSAVSIFEIRWINQNVIEPPIFSFLG